MFLPTKYKNDLIGYYYCRHIAEYFVLLSKKKKVMKNNRNGKEILFGDKDLVVM